MGGVRFLVGVLPFVGAIATFGACSQESVQVGLVLRLPQGDVITDMQLRVSDDGSCNAELGRVSGESSGEALQIFEMDEDGCAPGASWCKEITLDKDDSTKIFHAIGKAGDQPWAEGCATAVIDQDPLQVDITLKKYQEPACCNDGIVQAGEQCDAGIVGTKDCSGNPLTDTDSCRGINTTEICECDCQAREILLSLGSTTPPILNNDTQTKTQLALEFSGNAGQVADSLRAVFTDTTGSGDGDINIRLLQGNLHSFPDYPLNKQLRMPLKCTGASATIGIPLQQHQPALARVSSEDMAVAFTSAQGGGGTFDIWVSRQGPNGCAYTDESNDGRDEPKKVSTTTNTAYPDISGGPDGQALVVWNQNGMVRGQIWKTDTSLVGPELEIGALNGTRPRVAGNKDGWVVTYAGAGSGDGDGVLFKTVSPSGQVGSERLVNVVTAGPQDQPDVAMLDETGDFVIVWHGSGAIYFQRYDATAEPRRGAQAAPLSRSSPAGSMPAVAAGAGIFAATWLASDGTVWARFMKADKGFGFNHVTGQNDDFKASHPAVNTVRAGPAVAIGGAGFVAFGWQDTSTDEAFAGVRVRRFPIPQ